MALGNLRPGKRELKNIENRLDRHWKLMQEFIADGMDKDSASEKAFRIVSGKESK